MIIDMHCHILPGVDDGAVSMEDALEMAHQALDSGITHVVATPHYNYGSCASMSEIKDAYLEFLDALEYEQLPLRVQLGMEILASDDLPQRLQEKKVWTYPGSHYFLVEFLPGESPAYMDQLLADCKAAGFTPVVAHPERYYAVREEPQLVKHWNELGYGVQINRDSLLGRFGNYTAQCAEYLLRHRWANCIASDAHNPHHRSANWEPAFDLFREEFNPKKIERCLEIIPDRILKDQPLMGI